jgi:Ser/Thr protein kinase RdoA (MazF antagonist)
MSYLKLANIDEKTQQQIYQTVKEFDVGDIQTLTPMQGGLINKTYRITTNQGRFVFQQLSPIFDIKAIENYCSVERFLRTKGIFVPVLIRTKNGKSCVDQDSLSRLFEYVPHTAVNQANEAQIKSAATFLGRFHESLETYTKPLQITLPGFHDTKQYITKLKACMKKSEYANKHPIIHPIAEYLLTQIKSKIIPLDNQIIHADTKVNNFIFTKNKATGILDLDTLMRGNKLIDWGDGLRSWCKAEGNGFSTRIFNAAYTGYKLSGDTTYSKDDFMFALQAITLELGVRFITDAYEESYFGYEKQSQVPRWMQNVDRAKHCLEYFDAQQKK